MTLGLPVAALVMTYSAVGIARPVGVRDDGSADVAGRWHLAVPAGDAAQRISGGRTV